MSHQKVIPINKPVGLTPLESLQQLRQTMPELKDQKLSYSGRLDPMASGVILVLVGEETKNREHYQNLDKTYQVDILFGLETDTYDSLGILKNTRINPPPKYLTSNLQPLTSNLIGTIDQPYPPYSYIKTKGHPLWWWAKNNRLDEITIPSKQVTIHSVKLIDFTKLPLEKIIKEVITNINKVSGDFRQSKIISHWQTLGINDGDKKVYIAKLELSVSSGTYIRSISHELGQTLGTSAIALHIHRTRVGEYNISKSISL